MRVLALDTSRRGRALLLLVEEAAPVAATTLEGPMTAGLGAAVRRLGLDGVDAVVAVTGPGSYTGLRAGLAAALGVAQSLGLPLHGVSALEVVAAAAPAALAEFLAVADAGRGGLYVQRFTRRDGGVVPAAEPPERIDAAALPPSPEAVRLGVEAAPAALAAAVPVAVGRPALDLVGLRALYVDATEASRPA